MDTRLQKEDKPEIISPPDSPILTPKEQEISPMPNENSPAMPKPEIQPAIPPDFKPMP